MKNKIAIILLMLLSSVNCVGQNRNSVWVFGDSAGIDFSNTMSPQVFASSIDTRGSCFSIADTNGKLLFYAETKAGQTGNYTTFIYDSTNNLILNGDSVFGNGWYHELIIIPMPNNDSLFYLFNVGVTYNYGLRYSIINMKSNGGLGEVVQKNILLQSFPMVDCLTAVKHGNGRDWWLIFRRWDNFTFNYNNEFHSYLISPAGIINYSVQMIGSNHRANQGELTFSPNGERIINTDGLDLLELFDFNRCTGTLSNPVLINPAGNSLNYHLTWSSAFSPNGSILYVSTSKDTNHVYQLDLTASNIYASRINLDTFYAPPIQPGSLKLAPDGKIYFSCAYYDGVTFNYPYDSSEYNSINMNLSVINYPDSLGASCDFQPFSFYLGGKRTYWGLPNNPDYELPALAGSPCDTLVGVSESQPTIIKPQLYIYYHPEWQTAFINASNLTGTKGTLEIFDVQGKMIHQEEIQIINGYYTRNFNMTSMSDGMYFVNIISSDQRLSGKIIKY